MKFFKFNEQDEKIIKLLKASKQNFRFDQTDIKSRLLTQIAATTIREDLPMAKKWSMSYATAVAIVLVFLGTSTTLAYANSSKPGDSLFFLDKAVEKSVISLPLPAAVKARVYADVAAERLDELKKLEKPEAKENITDIKAFTESSASLEQAVEQITIQKEKLEVRGKTKAAKRLNQVLHKLEGLAEQHEGYSESIKARIEDQQIKQELEEKIIEIRKAKIRARVESNIETNEVEPELKIETDLNITR